MCFCGVAGRGLMDYVGSVSHRLSLDAAHAISGLVSLPNACIHLSLGDVVSRSDVDGSALLADARVDRLVAQFSLFDRVGTGRGLSAVRFVLRVTMGG